ncbi:MAG: sigma-70 family RNA polymerase sigma factor [Candidatus Omnitrophica bacterium]|jgi:RNA polymerase sigma factor (sigma-70 family)|nr:sigma-70 family RNA polymerase sigma factor [Candidatus Omnitrophota bacterium]
MDFRILLEKITPALKYIARKHLFYSFYSEEDLYQEMCLYLWQHYGGGLPIGINEAYVIKGCEFHIQNFLRKGRPKAVTASLDEFITPGGLTFADILEDKRADFRLNIESKVTIDEIANIGLTDKEKSVLSYLLKGCTIREIAKELGVSHVMVLKHKKEIIKKWRKKGYQK